jgi:hypothetical protein
MSNTQKELERAYSLIKRDKTEDALRILRPIIEDDPENVHAWWLVAYAATEPHEVREALVKVLRIDPNYANAPKARDMLEKLNQEYPPDAAELAMYPELQTDLSPTFADEAAFFNESPFELDTSLEELTPLEPEEPFAEDLFGAVDLPPIQEDIFAVEDPFAEVPEAPVEIEARARGKKAPAATDKARAQRIMLDLEPEVLDDETLATREELAIRRRGRGRRLLLTIAGLAAILLVVVVALALISSQNDEDEVADFTNLAAIDLEGDPLGAVRAEMESALRTANLGEDSRAVLADSDLGDTLYVDYCGSPSPTLPQQIAQGMEIAAQKAPSIQANAKAIGVNVRTCGTDASDTLYRAVVSVEDATRYLNGELSWEEFQSRWEAA